jgi:rhodanese-related sulfurtransferase
VTASRTEPIQGIQRPSVMMVEGATMPKDIDREELRRLVSEGAHLVEVLPREEYEDEHLPGAINLPLPSLEAEARDRLDPARPVVVYCWDPP